MQSELENRESSDRWYKIRSNRSGCDVIRGNNLNFVEYNTQSKLLINREWNSYAILLIHTTEKEVIISRRAFNLVFRKSCLNFPFNSESCSLRIPNVAELWLSALVLAALFALHQLAEDKCYMVSHTHKHVLVCMCDM